MLSIFLLVAIFIGHSLSASETTMELIYLKDGTVIEGVVYKADSSFLYVKIGPVEKKVSLASIDRVGETKIPSQLTMFEKSCICPNCGKIAFSFLEKVSTPGLMYNVWGYTVNCPHCGKTLYIPWVYGALLPYAVFLPLIMSIIFRFFPRIQPSAWNAGCIAGLVAAVLVLLVALIVPLSVVY